MLERKASDMASSLRFIGSGNAFCPPGRFHSCVVLDKSVLIDAPPTILPQLHAAGISSAEITDLMITHWHGDHVFGLPFLLLERRFITDRDGLERLRIHLKASGIERMKTICELAFPGTLLPVIEERVEWIVNDVGEAGQWAYERFPVFHTPATEPHGYMLRDANGFTLLHTGDSGPCETIHQRRPESDAVILEMGVPDGAEFPHHHRPIDIVRLAESDPERTFLITHSYASGAGVETGFKMPDLPPNAIQVEDGEKYLLKRGNVTLDG